MNASRGLLAAAAAFLVLVFVIVPVVIEASGRHDLYYTLTSVALLSIASAGVWLTFYIGRINIGQGAFALAGGYAASILVVRAGLSFWLALPVAGLFCAAVSVLVGLPILRLRGHYFGIATLGIALAVQEIVANLDALGGGSGVTLRQAEWFAQYYYAMWLVCAVSLGATWLIARSKFGYALVAIRENEDAAAVLGVDPTRYKIAAWAISGMMAAAAGAVFAFSNGFIDPATAFAIDDNVFPIVMAILGGVGTAAGPLVGAFLLTAVNETLWSHFPQIHTLFFGAVIVLVVLFLPRGLLYLRNLRGGWRGFVQSLTAYRV
ncbi:MAG: branched-chain amino acid ABC transporter permease [Vulcanimicrobiaceae bacterium]